MTEEKTAHTEIGRYISNVLDVHFGQSPEAVKVMVKRPYLLIHLHGFMLPNERFLLKRKEWKRVAETRDLLMIEMKKSLIRELGEIAEAPIKEIYADWNLERETGLLIAIMEEQDSEAAEWPHRVDKEALLEKINFLSKKSQKEPDSTEIIWLNAHVCLIERKGIMVDIEKELIRNGATEELRLAKRPLEHRMVDSVHLEPILKRPIEELFLDWNFEGDKGLMVFILKEDAE